MYIWRRTPRWQPLCGTTLGDAPTVGSTGRWGQVPDAAAHDSRNPSTVRQDRLFYFLALFAKDFHK
jgi:hypothetical protein